MCSELNKFLEEVEFVWNPENWVGFGQLEEQARSTYRKERAEQRRVWGTAAMREGEVARVHRPSAMEAGANKT